MRLYRRAIPYVLIPILVLALSTCANTADETVEGIPKQNGNTAQGDSPSVLSLYTPHSSPANDAALLEIIDTIDSLNPSLQISATLDNDYSNAIEDAVRSSKPPDVFLTPSYDLPAYVEQGRVLPIPDEMIDRTTLLRPALDAVTVDGVSYCFPQSMHTLALLYNQDHFEEIGLDPQEIDWTWESLESALSATVALTDVAGITLDANFASWAPFYYQASERSETERETRPGDVAAAKAAAEFVASLFADGYAATPAMLEASWTGEAFAHGDAALAIAGDWIIPYLEAEAPLLDYGVTELPSGPAGKVTIAYVNCLAVHADSDNKDLALQLAEQLTSPEVLQEWTWASGGSISPYFEEEAEPTVDDPHYRPFLRSLRYAIPWTMQSYAERTAERFEEAVQLVIDDELDPEDVWEYANR